MYIFIWSEKYTTDFAAKHVFEWEVATTMSFDILFAIFATRIFVAFFAIAYPWKERNSATTLPQLCRNII